MRNESPMKKKPPTTMPGWEEENFDAELFRAMLLKGWLLPLTEDEVAIAESELDKEIVGPAPETLNPLELLKANSEKQKTAPARIDFHNEQVEENLAWAARNGKEIPPEVREMMRRDRQRSETECDDE
jgi:hypothetical protein